MKVEPKSPATQLARLRTLMEIAGHNYFERISIARDLLANSGWIQSEHGGNPYQAAEYLSSKYFHDINGLMSMWDMLKVVTKFPEEAQWKQHNYNLRDMLELCKAPADNRPKERTTVKVAEYEALKDKAAELESRVKQDATRLRQKDREIETLKTRVDVLEEENAHLKGRVQELERILETHFKQKRA